MIAAENLFFNSLLVLCSVVSICFLPFSFQQIGCHYTQGCKVVLHFIRLLYPFFLSHKSYKVLETLQDNPKQHKIKPQSTLNLCDFAWKRIKFSRLCVFVANYCALDKKYVILQPICVSDRSENPFFVAFFQDIKKDCNG